MADKWNSKNLKDSRYVWLPVQFKDNKPVVEWLPEWNFSLLGKITTAYAN